MKCRCGKEIQIDEKHQERLGKLSYYCDAGRVKTIVNTNFGPQTYSLASLVLDVPEGMVRDHIDGNIHNNLESNLRAATRSQSSINRKLFSSNTSGYRGVRYNKGYWYREISVNGKKYGSRGFATCEEAAHDYDTEARKHHGAFARLNFPLPGERSAF